MFISQGSIDKIHSNHWSAFEPWPCCYHEVNQNGPASLFKNRLQLACTRVVRIRMEPLPAG